MGDGINGEFSGWRCSRSRWGHFESHEIFKFSFVAHTDSQKTPSSSSSGSMPQVCVCVCGVRVCGVRAQYVCIVRV